MTTRSQVSEIQRRRDRCIQHLQELETEHTSASAERDRLLDDGGSATKLATIQSRISALEDLRKHQELELATINGELDQALQEEGRARIKSKLKTLAEQAIEVEARRQNSRVKEGARMLRVAESQMEDIDELARLRIAFIEAGGSAVEEFARELEGAGIDCTLLRIRWSGTDAYTKVLTPRMDRPNYTPADAGLGGVGVDAAVQALLNIRFQEARNAENARQARQRIGA